jgi:hypothetical protein
MIMKKQPQLANPFLSASSLLSSLLSTKLLNMRCLSLALIVVLSVQQSSGFVVGDRRSTTREATVLFNNFWKNVLGGAFENDTSLSRTNKREGAIDEGLMEDSNFDKRGDQYLTPTQEAWRQKMDRSSSVSADQIVGIIIDLNLFLTGVPNKDPSNDLFGSKTSISTRDREIGQEVPVKPTITGIELQFLENFECRFNSPDSTGFFSSNADAGEWKLSDDGKQIRFRIMVSGYTRTVQTKGTIQKVFWSQEEERTTQTSTVYSIPEGWLYFDANVSRGKSSVAFDSGMLRVEQSQGLLGVATKMVPCGKFTAQLTSNAAVTEKS